MVLDYSVPHYIIETDSYIYEIVHTRGHARKKARMPVTVNGPMKFAIINSDFYLQDEQGQEYKMVVVKKTLKTPPAAQK